jgi:TolB protein
MSQALNVGTWGSVGGWTMRVAAGVFTAAALLLSPVAPHAHAQLRVTAVGEQYIPLKIAIPDFDASGPGAEEIARQLSDVIRADLGTSAPFRVLDKAGFIERDLDITMAPQFGNWTVAGLETQALVVGNVVVDPATNKLTVQFRLWDVYGQTQQFAMAYSYPTPLNWRRLAHKVADDVFTQLTGDPGYFDSRIAFVSKVPGEEPYRGRLAIMDQDGANAEFLLSNYSAVINPRFSPTDQVILYGAYVQDPRYPTATLLRTYLYDLATGRQEILDEGNGQLDFSARFSPDGRSIVFSRAQGGNTDIYKIDLATRKRTRLTSDSAIDVSPSFSPDGAQIVFQSDRGGSKQLYIMNADGTPTTCRSGQRADACRITFETGYSYSDPVWSPRGDWIAFSRQGGGQFVIGVIGKDGTGLRILTDGYQDESPSWSPNGRVIAFERTASRAAGPKLHSVDLTGRNERRLPTPRDATNPAWGPVLKME